MEEHAPRRADLRCPICQKGYPNEINRRARSKHISYCRKKHQSSPVSRRKACDECVRAKVRCSFDPAGCSRCNSRGSKCTFSSRPSHNPDSGSPTPNATGHRVLDNDAPIANVPPSGETPALSLCEPEPNATAPATNTVPESIHLQHAALVWDGEGSGIGLLDLLDPLMTPGAEYHPRVDIEPDNTSAEIHYVLGQLPTQGRSAQPSPSIPASLPYQDPSSMLERRVFSQPDLELSGDLALHILRSYLYVMADRTSVPPFIHPKYRDLADINAGRPSPLNAAMNFARVLFLGRSMNKSLIWGLIRVEQERLLNDHPKFEKWEILEALQSLLLYILMRITEGRHEYTNFDTQLLISVNALCRHITANFGMLVSSDELEGDMIPWKDWVFRESRRRSATVFLIIDSILHARISDPAPSMPEYTLVPAPSPRALWDAENELDWSIEYAGHLHANAMHGILRNGDLVALKEAATGEEHDRWYAYADSFGLLVTLAANLII